jgi:predicted RNase H-like HicB family nuclease
VLNFFKEAHLVKPKKKFTVLIEQDEEGFYVATVPALRGCHTQAKTLDTLMKRVREVIQLCLEDDSNGAALLRELALSSSAPAAVTFSSNIRTAGPPRFLSTRVRL